LFEVRESGSPAEDGGASEAVAESRSAAASPVRLMGQILPSELGPDGAETAPGGEFVDLAAGGRRVLPIPIV
jgi:hypothetical protein